MAAPCSRCRTIGTKLSCDRVPRGKPEDNFPTTDMQKGQERGVTFVLRLRGGSRTSRPLADGPKLYPQPPTLARRRRTR